MRIVSRVAALRAWSDAARARGARVALVPTMGALHAGHLALVDAARARADAVCVSLFVNPTQFDAAADLAAYPRTLETDLARCRERGVDLVFAPEAEALYPPGHATWVEMEGLSRGMEGDARPGHFRGVATVVTKLLAAARPDVACFGEKDWQQLAVVRRLARDLCLGVEILGVATVREPDGLALSSRNVHLDATTRAEAPVLHRALLAADRAAFAGERHAVALLALVRREIGKAPHAALDYASLVHPDTLEPVTVLGGETLLALAVRFPRAGGTDTLRLIDNRVLLRRPPAEDSP